MRQIKHLGIHLLVMTVLLKLIILQSLACLLADHPNTHRISLMKLQHTITKSYLVKLLFAETTDHQVKLGIDEIVTELQKIFESIDIIEGGIHLQQSTREQLPSLLVQLFGEYKQELVHAIQEDEEEYETKWKEISEIEKGNMDDLIMREYGVTPETPGPPSKADKKFLAIAMPLIDNLSAYKYATTFSTPVPEASEPEYYEVIYQPRDLKTIKTMCKEGKISNLQELEREIQLMFANAIMYNEEGSEVYNWAKGMQAESENIIALFREP